MSADGQGMDCGRVLVVDDQPENLALVEEILSEAGFSTAVAASGAAALESVRRNPPDCIVLDVMMPGIDGFEVCSRLKASRRTHFIPIVMLTALADSEHRVRALSLGADDFLTKPVNAVEVSARVRSLVRIKGLRDELESSDGIILAMVEALESTDPVAAGHSKRVAATALAIARSLRLSDAALETVGIGAALHDIGKIGLALPAFRNAPDLAESDRAVFRRHPELGEQLLAPFSGFRGPRRVVRRHHELRDGSGFPDGLRGDEIDLESEIVALANLYDERRLDGGSAEHAMSSLGDDARAGRFDRTLLDTLRSLPLQSEAAASDWRDLLPPPPMPASGRLLLVAAERPSLDSVARPLESAGFEIARVASAAEIDQAVAHHSPDLVMLDSQLDGGIEAAVAVTRRLRVAARGVPLPLVLITTPPVTGSGPKELAVDDLVVLPISGSELVARMRSLLRLRRYVSGLEERHAVIVSLAGAIEAKDHYTRGHSERVGVLAARIGRRLGLSEHECRLLRIAGLVHDIGKIGVPHQLLLKNGRLDTEELAAIRRHPALGERICGPLRTLNAVLPLIRWHHERLDGSGYPDGLAGPSVPTGARVLGLADAFDALTSARPYRATFSTSEALALLGLETARGRWDPRVLAALQDEVIGRRTAGGS